MPTWLTNCCCKNLLPPGCPVKSGAVHHLEYWDGIKQTARCWAPGMNSFNHYAYGAIGDWMYRVVAGLEIGAPGYKHIRIQPQPNSKLFYAKASYESLYGTITSGWEQQGNTLLVAVTIPPNTTATILLPGAS